MPIGLGIWWLCFFPISFFLQSLLPSVDVMLIGIILTLQEERYKDLLWILPLCILIQEGIGSREFGGMFFWYTAVIVVFLMGRWLFEVQNILFVLLLAASLGCISFALSYVFAPLQDLVVDKERLIHDSLMQSAFIPIAWWIATPTRRWTQRHDEAS